MATEKLYNIDMFRFYLQTEIDELYAKRRATKDIYEIVAVNAQISLAEKFLRNWKKIDKEQS